MGSINPLDSTRLAAMPLDALRTPVYSVCPHDCPSTCALEVERLSATRIGRVHGVRDHPYTDGVVCAKVARYAERVHHPDRLTRPLRRVGEKGVGLSAFEPIAWDGNAGPLNYGERPPGHFDVVELLVADPELNRLYTRAVWRMTRPGYLEQQKADLAPDFERRRDYLLARDAIFLARPEWSSRAT